MKKFDFAAWAAIAEIVGSIAVVISLVFVGYSVHRNTAEIYVSNENFFYQLLDDEFSDLAGDGELATVLSKHLGAEALSDVESLRLGAHVSRLMNRWELAHSRHRLGIMPTDAWENWDRFYASEFQRWFPPEWWPEWKTAYDPSFGDHVDSIISGR